MTLYSSTSTPMFRNVKLRYRKAGCSGCGIQASQAERVRSRNVNSCGVVEDKTDQRMSAHDLRAALQSGKPSKLIDVRTETEFGICSIPNSLNMLLFHCSSFRGLMTVSDIPHSSISRDLSLLQNAVGKAEEVYLVCRRGNDSLVDARALREQLGDAVNVHDLRGGLQAWSKLESSFPVY